MFEYGSIVNDDQGTVTFNSFGPTGGTGADAANAAGADGWEAYGVVTWQDSTDPRLFLTGFKRPVT